MFKFINKDIERIFFVEPNLIIGMGHVIEYPLSLNKFLGERNDLRYIANKKVHSSVRSRIKNLRGLISNTCFEKLETKGEYFCSDLQEMDKKYKLSDKDYVVILTSYWNEIGGASRFLINKKHNLPHIVALVHQIYPPESDFKKTIKPKYRKMIDNSWRNTMINLHTDLSLATPPCKKMNDVLASYVGLDKKIHTLPLPYEHLGTKPKNNTSNTRISFIGDGRYEKGLLVYMQAIRQIQKNKVKFMIQNIFPRGYSDEEYTLFNNLVDQLHNSKNVDFLSKPLFPDRFAELISSSNLMVLPYHPQSYDKRVSGVFIQAMQSGVPCVVTEGTWMAKEVNRTNAGVVFDYEEGKDLIYNSKNLKKAIEKSLYNLDLLTRNANKNSTHYLNQYGAKNFMKCLYNTSK